jgi:hypothetical protein
MDSEYTKEADFHYFKEVSCKNGQIYICLIKTNKFLTLSNRHWMIIKGGKPMVKKMNTGRYKSNYPKPELP